MRAPTGAAGGRAGLKAGKWSFAFAKKGHAAARRRLEPNLSSGEDDDSTEHSEEGAIVRSLLSQFVRNSHYCDYTDDAATYQYSSVDAGCFAVPSPSSVLSIF